jgi:hypothetical protein
MCFVDVADLLSWQYRIGGGYWRKLKWWHAPYKWKYKKAIDQGYVIYKLKFCIEKGQLEEKIAKKEGSLVRARAVVTKAREEVVEWQEEQQQASGIRRAPRAQPPTGLRDDVDNAERKLEKQERGKEAMRKELRAEGDAGQDEAALQTTGPWRSTSSSCERGGGSGLLDIQRRGSSSKEAPERPQARPRV